MKTLKIVIEKSSDSFGAYAQDVNGIYGAGGGGKEDVVVVFVFVFVVVVVVGGGGG